MVFFPSSSSSRTLFSLLLVLVVVLHTATIAQAKNIEIADWLLPYTGPTAVEATVGDTITFQWPQGHNVYIHPTMDCNLEGAILVGTESPTEYTFTAEDVGDLYFSCDIGDGAHCKAGQNLIATVSAGDGEADMPAPPADGEAPVPPAPDGDMPAPPDAPPAPDAPPDGAPPDGEAPPVEETDVDVTVTEESSSNGKNKMTMILGMMVLSFMMLFR
mmetsp:Transcript_17329/g.17408  ORF Transcript_17329/g.17408 Transcript_17329/m.17408 type:complete len:216 (+) Transcript_17329:88-735(+)